MHTIITDLSQIEHIFDDCEGWFFRGQSNPNWKLDTSLERAARRNSVEIPNYEWRITREFMRHAHSFLRRVPPENDTLEWLSIMQHYGAPTRLLDVTRSLWISIFFALEWAEKDFAVWAINPTSLACPDGIDFKKRLHELIFFRGTPEKKIYESIPFFIHERLALQQGTFLFSLDTSIPFQAQFTANRKQFRKFVFDASLRPRLLKKLNEMNCNSRVLFPGVDGYSRFYQNLSI